MLMFHLYLPSVTKKEELSLPSITWMTWINDFFVVTKQTDLIDSALDKSLGVILHLFQSKADQQRPLDVRKWQKKHQGSLKKHSL